MLERCHSGEVWDGVRTLTGQPAGLLLRGHGCCSLELSEGLLLRTRVSRSVKSIARETEALFWFCLNIEIYEASGEASLSPGSAEETQPGLSNEADMIVLLSLHMLSCLV